MARLSAQPGGSELSQSFVAAFSHKDCLSGNDNRMYPELTNITSLAQYPQQSEAFGDENGPVSHVNTSSTQAECPAQPGASRGSQYWYPAHTVLLSWGSAAVLDLTFQRCLKLSPRKPC